jgi:hypothetical protein
VGDIRFSCQMKLWIFLSFFSFSVTTSVFCILSGAEV